MREHIEKLQQQEQQRRQLQQHIDQQKALAAQLGETPSPTQPAPGEYGESSLQSVGWK